MTENLKKFLEEVEKNKELKAKLEALTDKDTALEKVIEIAAGYGFTLTAEDFEEKDAEELSADELESVAGGTTVCYGAGLSDENNCACFIAGGAKKCGCFLYGTN